MSARCSSLCLSIRGVEVGTNGSPFIADVSALYMGITFAASILNFVVLTASLSAINSDIVWRRRMLHGMAEQGRAENFAKTSRRVGGSLYW